MDSRIHVSHRADDRSYFAILKKEIHALAVSAGFSERKVGEIDIIVAEMVSNLAKHARGGQLLTKLVKEDQLQGIEIIAIDNGPGMVDVSRMVADGVSTKNTLGHGLGAMKRLADVFQVYSQKEWGTVILARVFEKEIPLFKKPAQVEIKAIAIPKPGEDQCGDGYYYQAVPDHIRLFLGDGLGHGAEADKAVSKAIEAFERCPETNPVEIIRYIDSSVKKTRGLVATVAVFNSKEKKWKLCGVGNIATKISGPASSRGYMAYNGIVGVNLPRTLNAQVIEYEKGQHLVMCSDGLKSRWDTVRYPGILRYDLSIMAASLLKDFARNTDDMSVVACKINL
ncbi:MAG: ATP-binding protein [Williamsia sp.]|nr:ATP-binding protein [Williamsia sp.]